MITACFYSGSAEEHTGLSRALSQLAELEEKMEQLHHEQVMFIYCRFLSICLRFIGRQIDQIDLNTYPISGLLCGVVLSSLCFHNQIK